MLQRALLSMVLSVAITPVFGQGRVIYAAPDGEPGGARHLWNGELVAAKPFREALNEIAKVGGLPAGPLEIRLTAREGAAETLYRTSPSSFVAVDGWMGTSKAPLVIRGQVDRTGLKPRALTVIAGPSLRDTLCGSRPADCVPPSDPIVVADASSGSLDRDEALDGLWSAYRERPTALSGNLLSIGEQPRRVSCVRVDRSRHVELVALGLRDCWLPAVLSLGSRNVSLRDSVIQGSSYVLAAFPATATPLAPETAHSFEVTGNHWEPSPASYRPPKAGCDPRSDWDCPVSVWSDLPWGVTHSYFWEPLNGALFGSRDVLGNVRVADNVVVDAYNGVRAKASNECLASPSCAGRVNVGFEIARNVFVNVRDNPVEPEGRAVQWIIKHNVFKNVHGAISTDGVAGRDFLVFGNLLDFDDVPGRSCTTAGWAKSRKFKVAPRGGSWGLSIEETVAANPILKGKDACDTHRRGVFLKMGWEDATEEPPNRLLERLSVFNNSLRLRSPLYARRPASPLASINNAVEFAGCGSDADALCRQEPDPDAGCVALRRWTADARALHADCLDLHPAELPGRPPAAPHAFARNAFNRALGPAMAVAEVDHRVVPTGLFAIEGAFGGDPGRLAEKFRLPAGSILASAGCEVVHRPDGGVACGAGTAPIGAVQPDGSLVDVALPFGFPFTAALAFARP